MVEVTAVDDFLFVCIALDVTLDILVAKSPLYAPRTRRFSGDIHLTLDILTTAYFTRTLPQIKCRRTGLISNCKKAAK